MSKINTKLTPDALIDVIRASFIGTEQVYKNGSCILFFRILNTVFPDALPYWSTEAKHCITRIGEKYYDISGEVRCTKDYILDNTAYLRLPTAVAFPQKKQQYVRFSEYCKLY